MPRVVTYSMLLLSAAGAVASLVFFVVDFNADVESVMGVIKALFAGMFISGILTQHLAVKLVPNTRDRLLWKGVFRGCPRWMQIGIRIFWPFVFFAVLALIGVGHRLGALFVVFEGCYSISFCITYSFLHARPVPHGDKSIPV
jgi:hypothetical protein